MIISISAVWGLSISRTFAATLLLGSASGAMGAFSILSTVLHVIPVLGSLSGAGVTGMITTVIGEAYIGTLTILFRRNPGRNPTEQEIKEEFLRQLPQHLQRSRSS